MQTIKAKKLSEEAFGTFGEYTDFLNPSGFGIGGFFPDRVTLPVSGTMPVGFSPLVIEKPAAFVVKAAEYHNLTREGLIALDADIVIHVAPASNKPVPELTEAFLIPRGTFVTLKTGVWHMCPFPVDAQTAHVVIALPERTYVNDCVVVEYAEDDFVNIEL